MIRSEREQAVFGRSGGRFGPLQTVVQAQISISPRKREDALGERRFVVLIVAFVLLWTSHQIVARGSSFLRHLSANYDFSFFVVPPSWPGHRRSF